MSTERRMVARLHRVLPPGSMRAGAAVLTLGTAFSQFIPVAAMPLLTRLYTPSDFGVYALYLAVVVTTSLVASGRYEIAVPLPDGNDEASLLLVLSLVVLTLVALLGATVTLALILLGVLPPAWTLTAWVAPATILCAGAQQSLSYWWVRTRRFSGLSAMRVVSALASAAISVAMGLRGAGPEGLLFGHLAGQMAVAVLMTWAERSVLARAARLGRGGALRRLAGVYRDYPLVNMPHALLDGLRDSGITFALVTTLGTAVGGLHSLSVRILRAPTSLIGASLGQVYLQRAASSKDPRELRRLTGRLMSAMFLLSAPLFIALAWAGPQVFSWAFGPQWGEAGRYARVLSPGLLLVFVISPFNQLPSFAGELARALRIATIDAIAKLAGLIVAGLRGDPILAMWMLSLTSVVSGLYLAWWYHRLSGLPKATRRSPAGATSWAKP